jgi:CheY-like chemotaxis protein
LFVEDNLPLIEELAELLQAERRGIETWFAQGIPESLRLVRDREFQVVTLDVMLPTFPGVPPQDEGIYLGAWILGKLDRLPPELKSQSRPAWLDERKPGIIFLSSRTRTTVAEAWNDLGGGRPDEIVLIERLRDDAYEHCLKVLGVLDGVERDRNPKLQS